MLKNRTTLVIAFGVLALGLTGCPDKKTEAPEGATAEPAATPADTAAATAAPAAPAAPAEDKPKAEKKDEGGW